MMSFPALLEAMNELASNYNLSEVQRGWARQARKEIIALQDEVDRLKVDSIEVSLALVRETRAEALKQAARVCETLMSANPEDVRKQVADRIRALINR